MDPDDLVVAEQPALVPEQPSEPDEMSVEDDTVETVDMKDSVSDRVTQIVTIAKEWLSNSQYSASDLRPLTKGLFRELASQFEGTVELPKLHQAFVDNFVSEN